MTAHFFRHTIQVAASFALAFSVTAMGQESQQEIRPFTVASWGGTYAEAQLRALFKPFANTKELAFDVVDFPGDPAAVDYQIQNGRIVWDVVDLEAHDAAALCERGALESITPVTNQLDEDDFVPGALGGCSIGNVVWSSGVVIDPTWFDGQAPDTFADFFDPEFPGPRALAESPIVLLELASIASGIAVNDIYNSLGTSEGIGLALDTLGDIRDQITWHQDVLSAFEALNSASASMALLPHILPARQAVEAGTGLIFLWDQHLYQMDAFATIKGSANQDIATSFLVDSGLPAYQGTMATLSLYGPTNYEALDFISQSILPWMPHAQDNRDGAIMLDMAWWDSTAGQAAIEAFQAWRAN